MTSDWFYEHGRSFGSTSAYRLSFDGWRGSVISTGGGEMEKLRRHWATFS